MISKNSTMVWRRQLTLTILFQEPWDPRVAESLRLTVLVDHDQLMIRLSRDSAELIHGPGENNRGDALHPPADI